MAMKKIMDQKAKKIFVVQNVKAKKCEMYCNFYGHHYDMKITNCRFFNSYGPGEVPGQYRNVIHNFIYWAMNGLSLPITGDGSETRDFTYVLDLVQGLIKAAFYESAIGENFNLAAGREVSIIEMVNLVNAITANKAPILYKAKRKWDTKSRLCASIKKANSLIDYKPVIDFETGFNSNVEWFKDNWDLITQVADFTPGLSSDVR